MQSYAIRFKVFNANGSLGNMMTQVITAYGPIAAMQQLRAMYGKIDIMGWNPV